MKPRRPFAELVCDIGNGSRLRVLAASTEAERGRYWLCLTDDFIDVLIERDFVGYGLSIGRSRSPPRECGRPGATEGLYLWEDVRVALEDPDLPECPPQSLEEIVELVAPLEDRLGRLFSDKSFARLNVAEQNRIATRLGSRSPLS